MLSLELQQINLLDLDPKIILILQRCLLYKANLSHAKIPSSANTDTI